MFFYVQINHYLFFQIYHFNFCSKIAPVINNLFTIYHNLFYQKNQLEFVYPEVNLSIAFQCNFIQSRSVLKPINLNLVITMFALDIVGRSVGMNHPKDKRFFRGEIN